MSQLSAQTTQISIPLLDRLFAQLEDLARRDAADARFHEELVDGLRLCGVPGEIALWRFGANGAICQTRSSGYRLSAPSPTFAKELNELAPDHLLTVDDSQVGHSQIENGGGTRVLALQDLLDQSQLLVDLCLPSGLSATFVRQVEQIAQGIGELTSEYLLRRQYRSLQVQLQASQSSQQLLELLTVDRPFPDACGKLASLLLETTDSDRVSVLQQTAYGTRLIAIAPATDFDRNLSPIKAMEAFIVGLVAVTDRVHFRLQDAREASQAETALIEGYVELAQIRELWVWCTESIPKRKRQPSTVLMIERFTDRPESNLNVDEKIRQVLPVLHALAARRRQGFLRWWDAVQAASWLRKFCLVSGVLLFAILSMWLAPADLQLSVEGQIVPVGKRSVFAPCEGTVAELFVKHGESIEYDQVLLTLQSHELDREQQRLFGEQATLDARLAGIRATKSQLERQRATEPSTRLTVQEEDLKIQLKGIREQIAGLATERERLSVRSPIAGVIDGFDLERSLPQRPVVLGQFLFDVIDPKCSWELQLEIPDRVIGYVVTAQHQGHCPVRYRVRSAPTDAYAVNLESISQTTQLDEQGRAYIRGTAKLPIDQVANPRAGARVTAKVGCGRRSLGFVWFHELIEFLQRQFWF